MKPDKTNKMVTNYSIPDMTRKYQNEEYVINMKKKRSYESFAEAGAMEKLNIDKKIPTGRAAQGGVKVRRLRRIPPQVAEPGSEVPRQPLPNPRRL